MTLGIVGIGVEIPPGRLDNSVRVGDLNTDLEFLDAKIGTSCVSRMESGEDTSTLATRSCRKVLSHAGISPDCIECLILCTQNPDAYGIPHTSAVVHAQLGLAENCACFDISLGCSGFVYGLSIILSFMQANGMKCGLLVTADPYSKIIDPMDRNTVLLFGDAATATLISTVDHGARFFAKAFEFATRGSGGKVISNPTGKLEMDGRAVFEFALTAVPKQIRHLLAFTDTAPDSIDCYLFHQGSKFIVEQLTRTLDLPANKVPVAIGNMGNTVSSSIPILLADCIDKPQLNSFVLSGFGVGLSWATCLLYRR